MGMSRTFAHEQGLQDHMRAKHMGNSHATILPDWASEAKKQTEQPQDKHTDGSCVFGECDICGFQYLTKNAIEDHANEFIPSPVLEAEEDETQQWRCSYCYKTFRDQRAQLQHENFCFCSTG
jgi:hypothetical protein